MSKITLFIAVMSLLCIKGLHAQPAAQQTLTIEKIFELADLNSKSIRPATTGIAEAGEAVKEAKNARLPEIDVTLSGSFLGNGCLTPERGFSYMHDAPLDMRMDESAALTAAMVVNTYEEEELCRVLRDYGEERYAPRIAHMICEARGKKPIETTFELVELIKKAMPAQALREKQHPAKRSFQAIRIAVNGELNELVPMMEAAVRCLNPGGRLAVITFHSLEDRIIKQTMKQLSTGCTCPPQFPVCVCGNKPKLQLVTRKPIVSGEDELSHNPRARSAKLRIAQRTEF